MAWFRPTLLPRHWHVYLNLLAQSPNAFIVSENAAAKYGVKRERIVELGITGGTDVEILAGVSAGEKVLAR